MSQRGPIMTISRHRRVVIVTPGQLGSNPRVVKEAQALHDAGHDVHVIATKVSDFVEPRDQAILSKAAFKVTRVPFDNRMRWLLQRFVQEGSAKAYHLTSAQWFADFALSAMTRRLTDFALATPADLYIAHYVAALPAAARAARRHNTRYAFDAEDFHLGDMPDHPVHEFERRLIHSIEGAYLAKAAYVSAASPLIAQAYFEKYGIALPTTILNVFPRTNAPPSPTLGGTAHPGPSIYWFSQTIGPGRGLEMAIEAIARTRTKPHLYLRGTLAPSYDVALLERAAEHKVADRVHFLAPIAPAELERAGAIYDVGLVLEQTITQNRQIALTNKLFSFLSSGLAVVATDIPAHAHIADRLGGTLRLVAPGDSSGLAAQIDALLEDPAVLADARKRAWNLGQSSFSWEAESLKLKTIIDQATSSKVFIEPN